MFESLVPNPLPRLDAPQRCLETDPTESTMISRRRFLQSTASLALLPLMPRLALSADLRVRPSWSTFCTTPMYTSFCNAIAAMRANQDVNDPNGWPYWAEVHRQFCPHGKPYFLAWHRGLLYRFEGRLRQVSGDPTLVLPYWNYYEHPTVPPEFLDSTSPLYRPDRTGTDVSGALSLDPFADTVTNFQRGLTNPFEALVESRPHNPVHNLIGGIMSSISYSPKDPLFFVHHANIDRLWAAWLAAGGGRHEPASTNSYWSVQFQYGAGIRSVPGTWTTTTTGYMAYQYDDQTLPTALPSPEPPPSGSTPPPATSTTLASSFSLANALPTRPATVQSTTLGTSQPLVLDERSISVSVPLGSNDASRVRSLMLKPATATASASSESPLRVILDGVQLTGLGEKGGYFYKVYLNLPTQAGTAAPERTYLLGTLGAFEISVAKMQADMQASGMHDMAGMQGMSAASSKHDVRLVFPATEALRKIWPTNLDTLTVSFVRVNGSKHPTRGQVIKVRAFSVEVDPSL